MNQKIVLYIVLVALSLLSSCSRSDCSGIQNENVQLKEDKGKLELRQHQLEREISTVQHERDSLADILDQIRIELSSIDI